VRIDAKSGDAAVIDLGPGRLAGEFVHVPRAGSAAEDDGWLLSLLQDTTTDRGELVVYPAGDPAAGPVARVLLPSRIPLGFHGNWVAG
jgi:carotenoid cleavage dioxygenase